MFAKIGKANCIDYLISGSDQSVSRPSIDLSDKFICSCSVDCHLIEKQLLFGAGGGGGPPTEGLVPKLFIFLFLANDRCLRDCDLAVANC